RAPWLVMPWDTTSQPCPHAGRGGLPNVSTTGSAGSANRPHVPIESPQRPVHGSTKQFFGTNSLDICFNRAGRWCYSPPLHTEGIAHGQGRQACPASLDKSGNAAIESVFAQQDTRLAHCQGNEAHRR